jgi:hypothetical protein
VITITYHDKSEDEFKVRKPHVIKNDLIEIFTSESLFQVIPCECNVARYQFDKNFTKIQDLHAEKMKKEQK